MGWGNNMSYMYIVQFWEEFPASEYGGLFAVIADTEEECVDILLADNRWNADDDGKFADDYVAALQGKVKDSKCFPLHGGWHTHGVVDSITT
jgi:hypothetical protein